LRGTRRIILIVIGVFLALLAISLVLFVLGGETPGDGQGDPIGLSAIS
jgi:TM2 domain-containing membrane protein YozV